MPAGQGLIGTKYVRLNPIIDEAYLRGIETASGIPMASLVQRVDAAMDILNNEPDELIAQLAYYTDDPEVGQRRVGRRFVRRAGEYTIARPGFVGGTSYMLPIRKYNITTGFTEDGLFDITQAAFDRELDAMVEGWQMLYLGELLEAMFNPEPVPIARGSSILSPRFAGSGTGDYEFTGNYPNGTPLPGSYSHYFSTTVANLATSIATYTARLKKWHAAPFDLLGSANAIDSIVALADFVPASESGIQVGSGTSVALLDPDIYLGQLPGRVRVRQPLDALGSGSHFAITKTYGNFDPRNPLAWLYNPQRGREAYVRGRDEYPLAESAVLQWYGIGVSDRAGAVVGEIKASGDYAAPTLTF